MLSRTQKILVHNGDALRVRDGLNFREIDLLHILYDIIWEEEPFERAVLIMDYSFCGLPSMMIYWMDVTTYKVLYLKC